MKNYPIILILLALSGLCVKLQSQEWRLQLNGNETYPTGNELQGYHPILWYSSDDGRGIIVGGFGGGVSYTTAVHSRFNFRYQLNAQRSRFYEQPAVINDVNGLPVVGAIGINTNLNAALFVLPQFSFNQHLKAGFGLGLRYTAYSRIYYGYYEEEGKKMKLKVPNESMAPFVAFVPVEITAIAGRFSLGVRAEPALTNVSRLSAYSGDRSTVLFVELGYKL
jgi:hypothetical protein